MTCMKFRDGELDWGLGLYGDEIFELESNRFGVTRGMEGEGGGSFLVCSCETCHLDFEPLLFTATNNQTSSCERDRSIISTAYELRTQHIQRASTLR